MTGLANKGLKRGSGQKRHHKVRFFLALFLELSNVEDLNYVGMAHGSEHIAFLVEQLQRSGIGDIENRLDRHFPANHAVIGPVNQAHAALAENLPHLVAACQLSWCDRTFHEPPQTRLSILQRLAKKGSYVLQKCAVRGSPVRDGHPWF